MPDIPESCNFSSLFSPTRIVKTAYTETSIIRCIINPLSPETHGIALITIYEVMKAGTAAVRGLANPRKSLFIPSPAFE